MKKEDFLLKLAREELTDGQIRSEFYKHYGVSRLEQAEWDLKTIPMCCITAALMACQRLTDITKAPCLEA